MQGELEDARAFLGRYQLPEDEVAALYATAEGDADMERLFAALSHVRQVKADCKALLAAGEVNCAYVEVHVVVVMVDC